jgi:hypothetical protein
MFIIYLDTKRYARSFDDPLVSTVKRKENEHFRMAAMLVSRILP